MAGHTPRPDVAACVSSGLFDVCLEAVRAFEARGLEGLRTVSSLSIYYSLRIVSACLSYPGCTHKIRAVSSALGFCPENSVEVAAEVGQTSCAIAAGLCASHLYAAWTVSSPQVFCKVVVCAPSAGCSIFGRDEGGIEHSFSFTQKHIDILVTRWSGIVRREGINSTSKPTADTIAWCVPPA